MSIRLAVSVVVSYGFISRFDSAINHDVLPPPPEQPEPMAGESGDDYDKRGKAWLASLAAWRRPLDIARETGDYAPILTPGEKPLIFKLRQIPVSLWAKIDRYRTGMSDAQAAQLIVRVAVVGLDGDAPVESFDARYNAATDPTMRDLGPIKPEAFVDLFTGCENILTEIATHVANKRRAPGN